MMKTTLYFILALCLSGIGANAQGIVKRTDKGVVCQVLTPNTGEKIKLNDVISFNAVQKNDKDSILFSTYAQGRPVKVQVRPSSNPGDLMDVFPLLAVNDSAVVKVPVDSVFKGHEQEIPPFLKKGGNIVFVVKITKVQSLNDAMAERNAELEKVKSSEKSATDTYIKEHNLTPLSTPSGLKYIIKKAGIKPRPQNGDTVYVNYTGRTLDGKVFDSSIEADAKAGGLQQPGRTYEPINFALGTSRVIKGWDEGLLLLNEGSKATFIVPSALGYGDQGSGAIPPFSTLLFDVELVKVVHVKHAPAKPAVKAPVRSKGPVKKRVAAKKKK
jgi:FKBP-type peptidyl-prolyl cis-trans isomerase FkpA